jgi:hypothetical protein
MGDHPVQVAAGIMQVVVMVVYPQVELPQTVALPMEMAAKQAQPEATSPPLQEPYFPRVEKEEGSSTSLL